MDETRKHIEDKMHDYERLRVDLEKHFQEILQKYQADRTAIDAVISVLDELLKKTEF